MNSRIKDQEVDLQLNTREDLRGQRQKTPKPIRRTYISQRLVLRPNGSHTFVNLQFCALSSEAAVCAERFADNNSRMNPNRRNLFRLPCGEQPFPDSGDRTTRETVLRWWKEPPRSDARDIAPLSAVHDGLQSRLSCSIRHSGRRLY